METVNVSSLKTNPMEALRKSQKDLVLVTNRNRPDAHLVGLASTDALDLAAPLKLALRERIGAAWELG